MTGPIRVYLFMWRIWVAEDSNYVIYCEDLDHEVSAWLLEGLEAKISHTCGQSYLHGKALIKTLDTQPPVIIFGWYWSMHMDLPQVVAESTLYDCWERKTGSSIFGKFLDSSPWVSSLSFFNLYPCCNRLCCCFSVAKLCLTLCDPMHCSTLGSSVLHYLPEFAQIHVHWASDAI